MDESIRMNTQHIFDRVHGDIKLFPLAGVVISTPEFHRLDGIRQLGGCAYVYPSATHTRREHSIGVAHLATLVARRLQEQRPDLVSEDDILCIQLAGLLHDLGHGPFSHTFEDYADPRCRKGFSHEEMGIDIWHIIQDKHRDTLDLRSHFTSSVQENMAFVDLLIRGHLPNEPWPSEVVGRPNEKRFLADIVHSRGNGVDVDKMDYLSRDALSVFGTTRAFDIDRIIHAVRIVESTPTEEEGVPPDVFRRAPPRLGFDEGVAFEIVELYGLRARLHKTLYQHRSVVVVEGLLVELMRQLDVISEPGKRFLDMCRDPSAFSRLTEATVYERAEQCKKYARDSDVCLAYDALFQRPWRYRIPLTGCLYTQPRCAKCKTGLRFQDAFCGTCGLSAVDVPHRRLANGLRVSPECVLKAFDVTQQLRKEADLPSLEVYIVDISFGGSTSVVDALGRTWRDFDPLAHVAFSARQDGSLIRIRSDAFQIPQSRHARTAYCYLPTDVTDDEIQRATTVFSSWANTHGHIAEE